VDLDPVLRRVRVRLQPAPGEDLGAVESVLATFGEEVVGARPRVWFYMPRQAQGLDVQVGDGECTFLVPPGECTLRAQSRVGSLRGRPARGTSLAEATVNVETEDVTIDLQLRPRTPTGALTADR